MSESSLDPRSESTRSALLTAAAQIFARDGFKAARTTDIAQLAQTPVSAINYHFGGKRGLYDAALLALAKQRLAQHPMPGPQPDPATRLRLVVKTFIDRLFTQDDSQLLVRLMSTEIMQSGPALAMLVENVARPQATIVMGVLRELLGDDIDEAELQRWFLSFFGQCLVYLLARPLLNQLFPSLYSSLDREALAQHIADVMLAAIYAHKSPKVSP